MTTQAELKQRIAVLKEQIEEKQDEIARFELDESDYEDSYIELLDCDGQVYAGGYYFYPSRILSELDPIAYSCGLSDYVDSVDKIEDAKYQELITELEELENELETLESEFDNLEGEE